MTRPAGRGTLATDRRGATAVEFALLAPIFLALLFAIIEGARLLWVKQAINEVAFSTARCASVSAACETAAGQKSYAVARAGTYGQTIRPADVETLLNTTCNATGGMVKVTVSGRFHSPAAGLLPGLPAEVRGEGCYPAL